MYDTSGHRACYVYPAMRMALLCRVSICIFRGSMGIAIGRRRLPAGLAKDFREVGWRSESNRVYHFRDGLRIGLKQCLSVLDATMADKLGGCHVHRFFEAARALSATQCNCLGQLIDRKVGVAQVLARSQMGGNTLLQSGNIELAFERMRRAVHRQVDVLLLRPLFKRIGGAVHMFGIAHHALYLPGAQLHHAIACLAQRTVERIFRTCF